MTATKNIYRFFSISTFGPISIKNLKCLLINFWFYCRLNGIFSCENNVAYTKYIITTPAFDVVHSVCLVFAPLVSLAYQPVESL